MSRLRDERVVSKRGVAVAWVITVAGVVISAVSLFRYSGWGELAGLAIAIVGVVTGRLTSGRIWPFLIVALLALLPILFDLVILLTWSDT